MEAEKWREREKDTERERERERQRDRERQRERERQRDREREKDREKEVMMGSMPEGQGKTRGRTEQQRKQVRDWEPERRIL